MRIADDIVLNPSEMVPGGEELNLSEMGITVVSASWGESAVEATKVRRQFGSSAIDPHPAPRTASMKLIVREDADADLATAGYRLQQAIALFQQEGGWIRRDFIIGSFAGSVLAQVTPEVSLGDIAGWQAGDSPDVSLTMVISPYWYSTEEVTSAEFKETTNRELIWKLENMLGTAPGLIRLLVKNSGTADWRGLISCMESRDYPGTATANTTAALAYECEALTPKGGAVSQARTGASGGKVVEHTALTAGWLTILNSEIAGVGHMTHKGVRRMAMRIYDPGVNPGNVQLRLCWRALGNTRWTENDIVPTPMVDEFAEVDLGECRPEQPVVGNARWEWQVKARAINGSGAVRLDRAHVLPTEQMAVVSAPPMDIDPDFQVTKTPGEAATSGGSGGEWKNPNNVKTSNDVRATAVLEKVEFGGKLHIDLTETLLVNKFGFLIPEEGVTITGVVVEIERSAEGEGWIDDWSITLHNGSGGIAQDRGVAANWPTADATVVLGGSTDLWGQTFTPAQINAAAFGVGIACGGGGEATARVDFVRITVYYSEATKEEAPDDNRVCFAGRSIEMRSDGCFRQHSTDDVWGEMVPEGFLHYAPSPGLGGRPVRGILVPSQGDFDTLADEGTNKLGLVVKYRPAYLFAREAA